MSPGAGDHGKEELLAHEGQVVHKGCFPGGVLEACLVHDWVPDWVLWGLVGVHTLQRTERVISHQGFLP